MRRITIFRSHPSPKAICIFALILASRHVFESMACAPEPHLLKPDILQLLTCLQAMTTPSFAHIQAVRSLMKFHLGTCSPETCSVRWHHQCFAVREICSIMAIPWCLPACAIKPKFWVSREIARNAAKGVNVHSSHKECLESRLQSSVVHESLVATSH